MVRVALASVTRESTISSLPPDLLHAICAPGGGRVVLVLGAGCSNEDPTSLPLAGDLSEECYRQLVADRILCEGDVQNQRDLSEVAEAVVRKTGSQRALVDRFTPEEFRNAQPNDGYLVLTALLLEGALSDTMTLNFDNAARSALAQLGARASVSTIKGPEDHSRLGAQNLIYLHRNIDSCPDELIIRPVQLEEAWKLGWETVIARRVLASPIIVFVGLGSPASVLIETTKRIRQAIGASQTSAFVVDPLAYEDSDFAAALEIPCDGYFRMAWGEFMQALGKRVVAEQLAAIESGCDFLTQVPGIKAEDVADLCARLAEIGLLGLGRLRACWMLQSGYYLRHETGMNLHIVSDLVLAIRMVERESGTQARFGADGVVEFSKGGLTTRAMFCHGGGTMPTARVEVEVYNRREDLQRYGRDPSVALVAGLGHGPDIATPTDIAADTAFDDIVAGPSHFPIVSIAELRDDPGLVREVIR